MDTALNPKAKVAEMLKNLPDDSSFEDIEYHLYVLHKIHEGVADSEAGRVYTHEEVKNYFRKWLVG